MTMRLIGGSYQDTTVELPEKYQLPLNYFMGGIEHPPIPPLCRAVMDDEQVMGFEWDFLKINNDEKEKQTVFWNLDQHSWPGLRVGTYPPKSWNEDYTRAPAHSHIFYPH